VCSGSAGHGRACAEYSRRIILHYLPTVNIFLEVLASKLVKGDGGGEKGEEWR